MTIKFLLPILAGFSIVLQGTLNRNSASQIGLVSAIFLNAMILLVFSGALWFLMKYEMIGGGATLSAKPFAGIEWWQFLPGICGFLIVFSTPLAIESLGANLTFAAIICTQLAVSMLWDCYTQKSLPSPMSLLGVGVMFVGLVLLMVGRK
ncbi:DMT family transporter [Bdellovibrio bacteriovorus]|uniref:DMT family transporter n=1 Tax=Bdellovibrio bacteriovorus TaxID=959 RepID=UPI0035A87D31